ncbi:TPA: hypothetical protein NGU80_004753 [Vibrio parahaemolyticus]|uniref:hypothetical protein n=1 Tax=Vibrio harveyi group TaxID=717610 RepID=UPI00112188C7|nr:MULTISPECIES: hypothetical protein [Vibrio harveyi group]ELB1485196.1 hypothetical protein [Vibrio parahaemolyticus]MBM4928340.1 hypothetical protein [Vibrio parahaemolyticus]MBS9880939.1 hypothetical protein [Vibrio alginolyticus]TOL63173.1 hypothetical protein CGH93_23130 [Vibrio parahaemolyticus]HCE4735547.1 hypothetical protein [Vibrio parahaemolyticus]
MKNVRMQFDFSEDRVKELEAMMDKCGISTRKELFNNALTILEWALEESERGHEVAAIDRDAKQFYALRMPILSEVRKSKAVHCH